MKLFYELMNFSPQLVGIGTIVLIIGSAGLTIYALMAVPDFLNRVRKPKRP